MRNKDAGSKQSSGTSVSVQTLWGLVLVVLVVLGAGGIVYRTLAPEGWLARCFDRNPAESLAALLALATLGLAAWLTRAWVSPQGRNRLSELLVFVLATAGLVQVVEFLLRSAA